MDPSIIIGVVVVIFSIILHEVAHGYAADWLGDPTARYSGRLTLNPIPHIDPIGSVLLPGILALSNSGFLIGWAKPVPYNPYNVRGGKWGEAFVGFAGPLTNILLALMAGLLLRFFGPGMSDLLVGVLFTVGFSNLFLAILNLVPIPPLDGSKILSALLPYPLLQSYKQLEGLTYALGPFGLIIVLMLFVFVLSEPISAFVRFLFLSIVGV
jgi:Zn-dependent protease